MPVLYRYRDLRGTGTSNPPIDPLTGGRLAKRDRVMSAFSQADRTLCNTRRVIGRVGLHCSEKMGVGSVNPAGGVTQVYPTKTQERVALRVKYQPSPGAMPLMSAIVLPSGMTNKLSAGWVADIPFGKLKVTATFTAAGSTTVSWFVTLPVSGETWGGEKQAAGAAWASMSIVEVPLIAPDNLKDPATMRLWSECDTVEITVAMVGGCRVVDCVLQEQPWGIVYDLISDTDLSSTMTTNESGEVVSTYISEYPINERVSGVDPTYGSDNLADVVDRQAHRLGPILAQWTAWDETSQSIADSEAASVSTSSTSFVNMVSSLAGITWSADYPGWSLSSGGCAQDFASSNALRETRDANAVVSCRVWLYTWCTGTTGVVRAMSAEHSVGELSVVSATPAWRSFTCHLRCGLGAEDASSLVLLGKVGLGDTLHIRQMLVEQIEL